MSFDKMVSKEEKVHKEETKATHSGNSSHQEK
jgi:hypothetical protein